MIESPLAILVRPQGILRVSHFESAERGSTIDIRTLNFLLFSFAFNL